MFENVCFACFGESEGEVCPYCGYTRGLSARKYPLALPEGSVLNGRFIVGRVLGQGGFGITYIAKDYQSGSLVAIKEFFPDSLVTRTNKVSVTSISEERGDYFEYGKESFIKESDNLAKFIGQKNIVQVYSYFEENNTAYLAMEYLAGETMLSLLKREGKLNWARLREIIFPVMDALAVVHKAGLVHRDISPDNIFICTDGTVKLIDFGAARYSLGDRSQSLSMILKQGYAPKEQYFSRSRQGAFTDVYALAATMYRALTGVTPPVSIERIDSDELVVPMDFVPTLPLYVNEAVMKALSVNAEDRFQTIAQFREAIDYEAELKKIIEREKEIAAKREEEKKKRGFVNSSVHTAESSKPKCPACGCVVSETAYSCPKCGARLKKLEKGKKPVKAQEKDKDGIAVKVVAALIFVAVVGFIGYMIFGTYSFRFDGGLKLSVTGLNGGQRTELDVPETFLFIPVTGVDTVALHGDNLETVKLSKNITSFHSKSIQTDTPKLKEIVVAEDNPNFKSENGILYNKDMTELILYPDNKESEMFFVPDSVTKIAPDAFAFCKNLKTLYLTDNITEIGEYAFFSCENLSHVYCSAETETNASKLDCTVGRNAFALCKKLQSVTIPKYMEKVDEEAFESCDELIYVEFQKMDGDWAYVFEIGSEAFAYCPKLKSIELPKKCRIADDAFDKNTKVIKYDTNY